MRWRALVVAAVLVVVAGSRHYVLHARPEWNPSPRLQQFPVALDGWHSIGDTALDARTLGVLGVDEYLNRSYLSADGVLAGLYIGYYHSQRQGAAIHSPLNCLPGAGWQPVVSERVPLAGAPGSPVVNRLVVQKGESRQIVYYWYQSHGRIVASDYWSKVYLVTDSITQRRSDAALVRVIAPMPQSTDPTRLRLDTAGHLAELSAIAVRDTIFP